MYIYHPNTKMTHKNDGFIENLMKVPAPLKNYKYYFMKVTVMVLEILYRCIQVIFL